MLDLHVGLNLSPQSRPVRHSNSSREDSAESVHENELRSQKRYSAGLAGTSQPDRSLVTTAMKALNASAATGDPTFLRYVKAVRTRKKSL